MSLLKCITATEQTVAVGTPCRLHSICFSSDDEDLHVKIFDGGAKGTGTRKWYMLKDATTAIGDEEVVWTAGDPKGVVLESGMNVNITNDGGSTAGTGYVNVEYTPD